MKTAAGVKADWLTVAPNVPLGRVTTFGPDGPPSLPPQAVASAKAPMSEKSTRRMK
jgi:hypothetical protein